MNSLTLKERNRRIRRKDSTGEGLKPCRPNTKSCSSMPDICLSCGLALCIVCAFSVNINVF